MYIHTYVSSFVFEVDGGSRRRIEIEIWIPEATHMKNIIICKFPLNKGTIKNYRVSNG
jgi:hypothetical protein